MSSTAQSSRLLTTVCYLTVPELVVVACITVGLLYLLYFHCCSASIEKYLLEKSRIISQAPEERCAYFHHISSPL